MAMDSDGERDDDETLNSLFESAQGAASSTCMSCPADEMDGLGLRASRLTSRPPLMVGQMTHFVNKSCVVCVHNVSRL